MGDGLEYEAIATKKHGQIHYAEDLIDRIWEDRPALSDRACICSF